MEILRNTNQHDSCSRTNEGVEEPALERQPAAGEERKNFNM